MQADVRKVPIDREESTKRAEQLKNKEPLEKVCQYSCDQMFISVPLILPKCNARILSTLMMMFTLPSIYMPDLFTPSMYLFVFMS